MSLLCEIPLPIYDQREETYLKKYNNYSNFTFIQKKTKKFSVICKSILNNKFCSHGFKCRFAHSKFELSPIKCRDGITCKSKTCMYRHNETIDEYCDRLSINIK
jgi:hypothetical protein